MRSYHKSVTPQQRKIRTQEASSSAHADYGHVSTQHGTLGLAQPVPPKYGRGRQDKPSRLQKRLALQVRHYREQRGMSAEQLADKVGVRVDYILALERAERNITLRTLEAIARVLRTAPERLLMTHGADHKESDL